MGALSVLLKILAVAAFLLLAFCVALPSGINDFRAGTWTSSYDRLPHPDRTERILLHSGIIKISNGINCNFLIMEARTYAPGDEAAIRTFYDKHWLSTEPYSAQFSPDFIMSGEDFSKLEPYRKFKVEVAKLYTGPYYIMFGDIYFNNNAPIFDFRCV